MPHVFIVDDSVSVRKALEITFRRHGLQASCALSGEEALERLLGPPQALDLLMVDVIMPGMSGLELCSALRAHGPYRTLPMVLMSGTVDDAVRAQAREVGADAVLRKPFRPEELMPLVERLLGEAGAHTPASAGAAAGVSGQSGPPVVSPPAPAAPATPTPRPAPPRPAAARPDLGALEAHIARHQASGRTLAMVVLDAAGQPLGRMGQPLDAGLLAALGHLAASARVAGRWMSGPPQALALSFGAQELRLYLAGDLSLGVVAARQGGAPTQEPSLEPALAVAL